MHRMEFFNEVDEIDGRLARFEMAKGAVTKSFDSQPAPAPVHVEAVTVLLVVLNWGVSKFVGYLGDLRVGLSYDGRDYDLAYDAFPRAMEVRTNEVIHAPEMISDTQDDMGYALSYTLPLARNQVFLMHPGQCATLHLTRDTSAKGVEDTDLNVLVGAELNGDLGLVSARKRLLRRELNQYERALIHV